jgi:LacI family transcriptional regulator
MRGVTRYANLQRRWLLFKDLERTFDGTGLLPKLDGAIFGVSPPALERERRGCGHIVHCSGGGDPDVCPVVALDDVAAGAQAAEHLMDCRLERFAFYGYKPEFKVSLNRLAGFRKALQARGFDCEVCPMSVPSGEQRLAHSHRPTLIKWLRDLRKPVGILALDDTNAHDLAEACLEADIGVPDHVAIVGVNDDDLLCDSAWPPLSSVKADYSRMGFAAAKLLDRLLAGEVLSAAERLVLLPPLGVVQRQSTSVLAVADENLAEAIRFIREHACEPCTVDDVLYKVPVGRRWLERAFTAHLGRTPKEEITRVRIDTARRLLGQTDLPIMEVAARCGYQELKSFYTAFGNIAGTTPAAYRRESLAR